MIIEQLLNYRERLLMNRSSAGDAAGLQASINDGANIQLVVEKTGYTALHLAADQGHTEACIVLVLAGADINLQNRMGMSLGSFAHAWRYDKLMLLAVAVEVDWGRALPKGELSTPKRQRIMSLSSIQAANRLKNVDVLSLVLERDRAVRGTRAPYGMKTPAVNWPAQSSNQPLLQVAARSRVSRGCHFYTLPLSVSAMACISVDNLPLRLSSRRTCPQPRRFLKRKSETSTCSCTMQ